MSTEHIALGAIKNAIAPFSISAEGLAQLGFTPAKTEGAAKLYRAAELPAIRAAAARHLGGMPLASRPEPRPTSPTFRFLPSDDTEGGGTE